jgi:hypothetical protein
MKPWDIEGRNLVIVHWQDAFSLDDTMIQEMPNSCPRITVGWLLRDEEDYITIAADYQITNHQWSECNTIPRGMVTDIIDVKQPRRR